MGKLSENKYVVQSGDSLSKIAGKYGVSWKQIYELNKDVIGKNPDVIRSGMQLVMPSGVDVSKPSEGATGPGKGEFGPDLGPRNYAKGDFDPPNYKVAPGDTLISIGLRFNVKWEAIAKANKIKGDVIRAGQELRIPGW